MFTENIKNLKITSKYAAAFATGIKFSFRRVTNNLEMLIRRC